MDKKSSIAKITKTSTIRKTKNTKNAKLTTAKPPRSVDTTTARAAKNRRTIVDVCIGIFTKNANKPMYVKNIYNAMRQRHWRTEGKTPQQTISSKLNADYRFIRVSPNTFKMNDTFYTNRVSRIKKV